MFFFKNKKIAIRTAVADFLNRAASIASTSVILPGHSRSFFNLHFYKTYLISYILVLHQLLLKFVYNDFFILVCLYECWLWDRHQWQMKQHCERRSHSMHEWLLWLRYCSYIILSHIYMYINLLSFIGCSSCICSAVNWRRISTTSRLAALRRRFICISFHFMSWCLVLGCCIWRAMDCQKDLRRLLCITSSYHQSKSLFRCCYFIENNSFGENRNLQILHYHLYQKYKFGVFFFVGRGFFFKKIKRWTITKRQVWHRIC